MIILDGDILKDITSGSECASYENNDRLFRARRYSNLAKLLSDQGAWIIVCTIAMYDSVRRWNRENIKGYIEIFLNPPEEVLKARDRKGLFIDSGEFELPKDPDIVFSNDGTQNILEIADQIMNLQPKTDEDYDRDREYWNSYYQNINRQEPSSFAVYIEKKLRTGSHILELGCGNGRDSLFFLEKGHNVIAVDGSDFAINELNRSTIDNKNALFICDNFVKCNTVFQMKYDCIYSRFTLHAITEEQENELLYKVKNATNGIFCIEARTIHDDIFGMGEKVAHNSFVYNNHFRRFIDPDEFKEKLINMGFRIDYLEEKRGFSKTTESDPVLMRCIASID